MDEEIIKAAIEEFDENGIRFTMDDLAKRMRISKRTLYENISSKEELISRTIDRVFDDIKRQETEIAQNTCIDIIERIKRAVTVLPKNFANIDYNKIYEIKRYYPDMYKKIDERLSGHWETALSLFREGIGKGKIRDVNLSIIRQMILGTFRNLFDDDFLSSNSMTYEEALDSMMDIIMEGISVH